MSNPIPDFSMFSEDFAKLKPVCDKIIRNCTVEDLSELEHVIKNLNKGTLQALGSYIFFPLKYLLVKCSSDKLLVKNVDVLKCAFEHYHMKTFSEFATFFVQLFSLIYDPNDSQNMQKSSEELKSSVCACISCLVQHSSEEVIIQVFQNPFRLTLAQGFFTLIQLLKKEKSKSLRQTVLTTIGVLTCSSQIWNTVPEPVKNNASFMLAGVLPGLSSSLCSVVCGDDKQGQQVIRLALNLLTDFLALVVGDACITECPKQANPDEALIEMGLKNVFKDEEFFREASPKLEIIATKTKALITHPNWKVRFDFLRFAETILFECSKHLESCAPILLPAVFSLCVDNHNNTSSYAKTLIHKYSAHFQSLNSVSLCSMIEDNFYECTSLLIKSKLTATDAQKLSALKTLLGYFEILGDSVEKLLFSRSHLEKLVFSLIVLTDFDVNSIDLVVEEGDKCDIVSTFDALSKKRFLYFQSEDILLTICQICHHIGQSSVARLFVDILLEKLHSSELYVLQCIFLLGCAVDNGFINSALSAEKENLAVDIIEEVLSPEFWNFSCDNFTQSSLKQDLPYDSRETFDSKTIYQICLILEVVEKCGRSLGAKLSNYLKKLIFPVMEAAGNIHYVVSQSGKLCLQSFSRSCGYDTVSMLIQENADYLVNSMLVNFHHFLYRPEMAVVLRVAIEQSDQNSLHLFEDSIRHIMRILDLNQGKAFPLITVLKSVVLSIQNWFPPEKKVVDILLQTDKLDLTHHFQQVQSRKAAFARDDFEELKSTEKENVLENIEHKNNDVCLDKDDVKKELPLYIMLTIDILKRCSHFQSVNNLHVKVLALEIIEVCVVVLSDHEQQLNIAVHELWGSFLSRFSEKNIIVMQAFKVLLVLADKCGDFIRKRTMQNAVPKLLDFLKNGLTSSSLKNNFSNYQWTNNFKLQLCLLSELGDLFLKLDTGEKEIADLLCVCLPYLQNTQPPPLQNAVLKTMEALAKTDPDGVWFYYNSVYAEEKSLPPPHPSLPTINFPYACSSSSLNLKLNF